MEVNETLHTEPLAQSLAVSWMQRLRRSRFGWWRGEGEHDDEWDSTNKAQRQG